MSHCPSRSCSSHLDARALARIDSARPLAVVFDSRIQRCVGSYRTRHAVPRMIKGSLYFSPIAVGERAPQGRAMRSMRPEFGRPTTVSRRHQLQGG